MLSSLVAACMVLGASAPATQAPQWQADYGKALAETRADERPMVVVIDNPAVAEEAVEAELLADTEVLGAYQLCHVDVSTEYGQAVAEVFGAEQFPYVAIIDKSGEYVVHRHAGQLNRENWEAKLAKYEAGEIPRKVTVMKPVIQQSYPSYDSYPVYSNSRSNCPNCQRGY